MAYVKRVYALISQGVREGDDTGADRFYLHWFGPIGLSLHLDRLLLSYTFLAAEAADEGVEGGREEEAEAGHARHPERHRGAQRLLHLGTGSRWNGELPIGWQSNCTPLKSV